MQSMVIRMVGAAASFAEAIAVHANNVLSKTIKLIDRFTVSPSNTIIVGCQVNRFQGVANPA
jgi:hypothetical protein